MDSPSTTMISKKKVRTIKAIATAAMMEITQPQIAVSYTHLRAAQCEPLCDLFGDVLPGLEKR